MSWLLLRRAAGVPKLGGLRVNAGGIAGGIRLALHSATRMSPGLRPPPLFRSAERSTILIEWLSDLRAFWAFGTR
jgi:hypothetical protein